MALYLNALCFNATNPLQLARFWARTLEWKIHRETPNKVSLIPTDGTRFDLIFLSSVEKKQGKNRMHLDLATTSIDDQNEMVRRSIEHGARHIDIGQSPDEPHVVLADPEGNEFCVIEPGNSFVNAHGRFGSITCYGSREVGYFWSKALGWPLVWDQNEETAIRAPDGTGPFITWGGPPLPPKITSQLHLDVAPPTDGDLQVEIDRLISLGATRVDTTKDSGRTVMADPDGNKFCVLTPR